MASYSVIILAAGTGSRTGFSYNKILHKIHDKSILQYSIDFFRSDNKCSEILLVCNESEYELMRNEYLFLVNSIVIGGSTRQESVYNALDKTNNDILLIHDSARPFINSSCIDDLLDEVSKSHASTLAIPVSNTIVKVDGNRIVKTLDRTQLVQVQTPQAFQKEILIKVHDIARKEHYFATDDTDLVRKYSDIVPTYVMGDYRSIKLTTKDDIKFLEVIL